MLSSPAAGTARLSVRTLIRCWRRSPRHGHDQSFPARLPLVLTAVVGDLRRLRLGLCSVYTSAAHGGPPVQDQPVIRDDARPELDLRRGEIAAELAHDLLADVG